MRHLAVHAQDQRRALFARQLRDGGPDARLTLFPEQSIRARVAGRIDELPIGNWLGREATWPYSIEAHVDADPVQPGPERRLAAKVAQPAVGAHEDILRQV